MKKQSFVLLFLLFIPFFLSAQLKSGFYGSNYVSGYELNSITEDFESLGGLSQINVFKVDLDYIVWKTEDEEEIYYVSEFIENRDYDGVTCGIYSIKDKNDTDKEVIKFIAAYSENKFYFYINFDHSKDTYTKLMLFENVEEVDLTN